MPNAIIPWLGEMAERLKATVSKTVVPVSGTVGSNPTLSAIPAHNGLLHSILSTWLQTISGAWAIRFDRHYPVSCI